MRRLSTGGMGGVYLARQHRLGDRLVAVKVIPLDGSSLGPQHEPLPSIEQRFVREGKLLGHLTHPHILPVHDAGSEGNLLYLIMQYAPDGSLMDALRGRGPQPLALPLPMPFALDLLAQVASALQYIHAHGIVHRDVKPSNILVHVESAGHWHVMLADFGIARAADSTAQQHLLAGTLAYMAPEQFRGFYSPASDQYALAVVAYLLLSGRLPFPGDAAAQVYGHMHTDPTPPRSVNPAIPSAAEEAILRALSKRPGARYPSVASFIEALRFGATSGQATTASGITAPLLPVPSAGIGNAPPQPFIVAPAERRTRAAEPVRPLVIAPPMRPQLPGTSTTEAAIPPNRALGVEMAGERADNEKKPAKVRKRRAAALLTSLLLLLIALIAVYAFHGVGQFASGANQPPFKSMSGATAVAATDTATASIPPSSSGGGAAATAVATAAAGGAQNTPGVVPPAATGGAGGGPPPPANAAQVVTQPAAANAQPGQRYTMTATFANTGTATWRSGYGLLCDTSHHPQSTCAAGAIIPFSGYSVAPGQRVTFSITLVAPAAPGVYTSWWTLEQNGQPFGAQDVIMRVTVVPPASPTPSATATPAASPPTSAPSPTAPSPTAPAGSSATPHSS